MSRRSNSTRHREWSCARNACRATRYRAIAAGSHKPSTSGNLTHQASHRPPLHRRASPLLLQNHLQPHLHTAKKSISWKNPHPVARHLVPQPVPTLSAPRQARKREKRKKTVVCYHPALHGAVCGARYYTRPFYWSWSRLWVTYSTPCDGPECIMFRTATLSYRGKKNPRHQRRGLLN